MQKRKLKIAITVICFLFCAFCIYNMAFATSNYDLGRWSGNSNQNERANKATRTFIGTAIQIIRAVGTGMSIIMLSYVAIKYMMAAPEEKADFKKSAEIYALGAVLIFASTNIMSMLYSFANENITN